MCTSVIFIKLVMCELLIIFCILTSCSQNIDDKKIIDDYINESLSDTPRVRKHDWKVELMSKRPMSGAPSYGANTNC